MTAFLATLGLFIVLLGIIALMDRYTLPYRLMQAIEYTCLAVLLVVTWFLPWTPLVVIAALVVYVEYFSNTYPLHKYLSPEEMRMMRDDE